LPPTEGKILGVCLMHKRGQEDLYAQRPLPALYEPPGDKMTVFPGKPHMQQNLAVQRSIMDIFNEFTEIISGELKSMNRQEFGQALEQDQKRRAP
jgi:hypothetical protein